MPTGAQDASLGTREHHVAAHKGRSHRQGRPGPQQLLQVPSSQHSEPGLHPWCCCASLARRVSCPLDRATEVGPRAGVAGQGRAGVGKDGLTWGAGLCLPANLLSVLVTRRVGRICDSGSLPASAERHFQSQSGWLHLVSCPSALRGLGGGVCCASFCVTLQQRRRRDQGPVSCPVDV